MADTRDRLDRLSEQIDDLLDRWDDTDEVDTTLGVEIEEAGRDLAGLLHDLADQLPDHDPARDELTRTTAALTEAVTAYAELDEHDTNYTIDIVDRLGPALGLATETATA